MKEQTAAEIALPEITTYDRAELTVESAFTENTSGPTAGSDRKSKTALRKISTARILDRLQSSIVLPEITTYDRAELTVETGFAGGAYNFSDRKAKTALRTIAAARVIGRLQFFLSEVK